MNKEQLIEIIQKQREAIQRLTNDIESRKQEKYHLEAQVDILENIYNYKVNHPVNGDTTVEEAFNLLFEGTKQ